MRFTAKQVAFFVGGELVGDGNVAVSGINGIKEAKEGDLSIILSAEQANLINSTQASCVIAPRDLSGQFSKTVIKVDDPTSILSKIVQFAMPDLISHPKGVHPTAVISKKASIGKDVSVGAYVVIEEGANIGDNTILYPFCYIGRNTKIGSDCLFYPNVIVRERITIENRVIIHASSVIGSDGFGYITQKDKTHVKVPQIGTVIIEDDVEIGSCTTIDRARFHKTVIGKGSKIDNLVQIAHNVIIGPNCLIAAQTGISGSSELGRNCVLGGQVGIADHLKMGDHVMIGAQSGVTKSFPSDTTLFWYPAKPVEKIRDIIASVGLLPKLFERVRSLEAKIKELESKR